MRARLIALAAATLVLGGVAAWRVAHEPAPEIIDLSDLPVPHGDLEDDRVDTSERRIGDALLAIAPTGERLLTHGEAAFVRDPNRDEEEHAQRALVVDTSPGSFYGLSPEGLVVASVGVTAEHGIVSVRDPRLAAPMRLDPRPEVPDRLVALGLAASGDDPDRTEPSWGAPVFLRFALLATLHQEAVVLWNLETQRARCTAHGGGLGLTRMAEPFGPDSALVSSGDDDPSIANVTLVEISTEDCHVIARYLAGDEMSTRALAVDDARFLVDSDGVRVLGDHGERLAIEDASPTTALVADDSTLAWGAWRRVFVWDRERHRLARIEVRAPARVEDVRLGWNRVRVVYSVPPRQVEDPQQAGVFERDWWRSELTWTEVQTTPYGDPELAYDRAILAIGEDDWDAAARTMEGLASTPLGEHTAFLRIYFRALADDVEIETLDARLRDAEVHPGGSPDTLDAARRLVRAELATRATDVYMYWLDGVSAGSADPEGARVGRELGSLLSFAGEHGQSRGLARRLAALYPDDPAIREWTAELTSEDEESADEEE